MRVVNSRLIKRWSLPSHAIAAFCSVIIIIIFAAGCGGSSQAAPEPEPFINSLAITVVDGDGAPIEGAFVMLGSDPLTEFQGTTDVDGKISFSEDAAAADLAIDASESTLPGMEDMITVGKAGYHIYEVAGVDTAEATFTLSPLEREQGWTRISIDDTTWGALADDCPGGPGIDPCDLRVALVSIPNESMTDTLDRTACDDCLDQSPFLLPSAPGQDQKRFPAFLDQTRVFAAAGILDINTFTFTFSRFGIASYALDASNTVDNPVDVQIPLTMDLTEDSAVTISLGDITPTADEEVVIQHLLKTQYGLVTLGLKFGNVAIGGVEVSPTAYRFPGLTTADIAANADLSGATYYSWGGLSGEGDDMRISILSSAVIDSEQTVTVEELFGFPDIASPANGSAVADKDQLQFSWSEVEGADQYLVSLGTLFFNGTEVSARDFWEILVSSENTELTLNALPDSSLPAFEDCQAYRVEVVPFSIDQFSLDDGVFGNMGKIIIDDPPVTASPATSTFYTPGDSCGPLIGNLDIFEGAPGDEVTIEGMYFGDAQGSSTVTFGGTEAAVVSWSNDEIVVEVPAGPADTVEVLVTVDGVDSNSAYFSYNG